MKTYIKLLPFLISFFTGNLAYSQTGNTSYSNNIETRFLEAASNGDYPVVVDCIKKGVDINTATWDGVTALMYATSIGHRSMVKLLLDKGAKVNAQPYNGFTALITASKYGYTDIAEMLITDSADVNMSDLNKATALHYACLYNNDTIAFMLLNAGANPDKLTNDEVSPLSMAALNGSYESAYLLIDAGADVNSRDKYGFTPLMLASQNGYVPIVDLLLDNGAKVNIQNNKGYSALSFAIVNKHEDIVKILLQSGANAKELNAISMNARVLAKLSGDSAILDTIKKTKVKQNLIPAFKSFGTGLELNFNSRDLMTGVFITQRDIKFGLVYNLGFAFRPTAIRIKEVIPDFGYYQFMERRYIFNFDLAKSFTHVVDNKTSVGLNIGGRMIYSFGKYRGTNIPINGGLNAAPALSLFYRSHSTETRLGYYYTNYGVKDLPYNHFSISLAYHFSEFDRKNINRKLKWID